MTHLLDTDHLSVLQHPGGTDYAVLVARLNLQPAGAVGVSVVSYHEQAMGSNNKINQARTEADELRGYELLAQAIRTANSFPVVPFDAPAYAVRDALRRAGVRLKPMDFRIASIALARNLKVVTRNSRDFAKVPGLVIEDWTR